MSPHQGRGRGAKLALYASRKAEPTSSRPDVDPEGGVLTTALLAETSPHKSGIPAVSRSVPIACTA